MLHYTLSACARVCHTRSACGLHSHVGAHAVDRVGTGAHGAHGRAHVLYSTRRRGNRVKLYTLAHCTASLGNALRLSSPKAYKFVEVGVGDFAAAHRSGRRSQHV